MKFSKNDKVIIVGIGDVWENKKGIILADYFGDEITDETDEYLVKVFFNDERTITQTFSQDNLELDTTTESLNESKQTDEKDFIHDYVILSDIDDKEIPSWFFVDKLAAAENITTEKVIETAQKLGYKLFIVAQERFKKIVVAASKCTVDTIYDEYVNYLLGSAVITELKAEKE